MKFFEWNEQIYYFGSLMVAVCLCLNIQIEATQNAVNHPILKSIVKAALLDTRMMKDKIVYPKLVVDPDAKRNLTGLITSKGYPVEVYTVQTADGFLLDLHRIPNGRKIGLSNYNAEKEKPAVYLQHALLSSACDWVMNLPNQSLGFILADAGYDVWMGNSRGNTYSRRHIHLSPNDVQFWDWSFDEMALYDMPAFIDFILNKTGQPSLSVVGHSQGTMMNFALFSERPDMEAKVNLFAALAPVAYINHMTSPIRYLGPVPDDDIYFVFGRKDFLPSSEIIDILANSVCRDVLTRWLCEDFLFLIVGADAKQFNQSRMDVYFNHSPSGVSVKDMVHFAQLSRGDKFAKYDYGSREDNMKHYNQTLPPVYPVEKIKVPIIAFSGGKDWLADPKDVKHLLKSLPSLQAWYKQPEWNHMDFVWGLEAAAKCYNRVLDWLHKYNP